MQAQRFKSIYLDHKYYLFFFFLAVFVLSPDFLPWSKLFLLVAELFNNDVSLLGLILVSFTVDII